MDWVLPTNYSKDLVEIEYIVLGLVTLGDQPITSNYIEKFGLKLSQDTINIL